VYTELIQIGREFGINDRDKQSQILIEKRRGQDHDIPVDFETTVK